MTDRSRDEDFQNDGVPVVVVYSSGRMMKRLSILIISLALNVPAMAKLYPVMRSSADKVIKKTEGDSKYQSRFLSVVECSDGSYGYDSWDALSNDLTNNHAKSTFIICPESTFALNDDASTITISRSVDIRCGADGKSENSCKVTGGTTHFLITGESINVFFQGILLEHASSSSILAMAMDSSSANFRYCQFHYNKGNPGNGAAVEVRAQSESSSAAMTVNFDHCSFTFNISTKGAVSISDGVVSTFSFCSFHGNLEGGAIQSHDSEINLANTCFEENFNTVGQGIISLVGSSQLFRSSGNNFGQNNDISIGQCADVYLASESDTLCKSFDEITCLNRVFYAPSAQPTQRVEAPSPTENDTNQQPDNQSKDEQTSGLPSSTEHSFSVFLRTAISCWFLFFI